ncbi:MAG: hypothetical protein LBP21_09685 [Synergistaceae bacterium]|nr:hypothetical protein [Synergistaceae bacterium]
MKLLFFVLIVADISAAWAGIVTIDTSEVVAAYFEEAKTNEALLIAFLHKMPKGADLHNHPSGAIETETLLDNAIERDLVFDLTEKAFVPSTTNPFYTSMDLRFDFWKTDTVLDALGMRNMTKEKEDGHDHFFRSFARFGPAMPSDEKIMAELLRRAASQRISYMELMINVVKFPEDGTVDYDALKKQLQHLDDMRRDTLANLDERDKGWNVDVSYILTLNRGEGIPMETREAFDEKAYEKYFGKRVKNAMDLLVNLHECGVRGITLLSPEDSWFSRTYFDLQMRIIDENWRSFSEKDRAKLKLNLHAGELTIGYSPYEAMRNRISKTISKGHSSRIGHGVDVMWEDDVYGLLRDMREKGIAVEICLSSNEGILGVSGGARHPFRLYWDAGVPVAICTDDEGISRSNLTLEYAKAAKWFDLQYGELKWLAFNSVEYSFLPGESLFVNGDFNKRKTRRDSLFQSPKAVKQMELWDAFLEFESRMERNIELFHQGEPHRSEPGRGLRP